MSSLCRIATLRRFLLLVGAASLAVGAVGCKRPTGQQIVLTKDQEQQIAENVLTAPPQLQQKVDAKFEDKITLLGYDLKGVPAKKGGNFDVTFYFRVDQPVSGDWKIFVHLDPKGGIGRNRVTADHYGVGGLYPVASWKKGEIIRDTVTLQVPADWQDGEADLYVGFFDWGLWTKSNGNRRLKIVDPGAGKGDPEQRVLLTSVKVGGGGAPGGEALVRPPRQAPVTANQTLAKLTAAPTIDGKADDEAWKTVRPLADLRRPDGQPLNPALQTSVQLAWDADHLYFAAQTRDEGIKNDHKDNDSTLWEGDVIELFLEVPGKAGEYVELQFAPNGARFDAKFTGHRQPAWQEAAKFESGVKHAVSVDGSVGEDGAPDKSWSVEAAIPWKGLGLEGAPAAGTKIKANVYRIDDKGTHDLQFMGAWAPVGGDFHQLDGAGVLVLMEPGARND